MINFMRAVNLVVQQHEIRNALHRIYDLQNECFQIQYISY